MQRWACAGSWSRSSGRRHSLLAEATRDAKRPRALQSVSRITRDLGVSASATGGTAACADLRHLSGVVSVASSSWSEISSLTDGGAGRYDLILDRISHEVPFYRTFLKCAVFHGTRVINNPFWWSADDKFLDNVFAISNGVAVPRRCCFRTRSTRPTQRPSRSAT